MVNYNVNFKLDRTIYIENVKDEAEAVTKASEYLLNLFNQSIKGHVTIEAVKTGD